MEKRTIAWRRIVVRWGPGLDGPGPARRGPAARDRRL